MTDLQNDIQYVADASPAASGVRQVDGVQLPAPGTFTIDPAHTRVGFVARHLMVTKVRGYFAAVEGTVTIAEDPLQSSAEATIQTASIATGSADRDNHLRSGDFLETEAHPTIGFRIVRVLGHRGDTFQAVGELTIKGVSREVPLDVEVDGIAKDPWGNEKLALTARTEIDREDFGMTWNVALETGGVLVSKTVKIEVEAQAVRNA